MSEGDEIAAAVLEEFEKLPAKRKPCVRDNGLHEWVPLSGIVAKGTSSSLLILIYHKLTLSFQGPSWLKCVALAYVVIPICSSDKRLKQSAERG